MTKSQHTPSYEPVRIAPNLPNVATTELNHRHNMGGACPACEIVNLRDAIREALELMRGRLARGVETVMYL